MLPAPPPIQIAQVTDRLVRGPEEGWLPTYRRIAPWFEGGTPATNPGLDDI